MYTGSIGFPQAELPVRRSKAFPRAVEAHDIQLALQRGEFVAVFQPFVRPRTGRLALLEATVRWMHPQRGMLAPCDFVCEADQHGLLGHIAVRLLEQAARATMIWRGQPAPAGNAAALCVPVLASLSGAVLRDAAARRAVDQRIRSFGPGVAEIFFDHENCRPTHDRKPLRRIDLADCDDTRAALTPLLTRPVDGAVVALTAVNSVLQWCLSSEYKIELVQGDFICSPTAPGGIGAALRRWYANFDAINAAADIPAFLSPNQH